MSVLFPTPGGVAVLQGAGGTYVKGKWTHGTRTAITITGRVRHFTAFEISNLPEGKANVGHVKLYSDDPLNPAAESGDKVGDIIQWDGKYWEVTKNTHKPMGVIDHYRYTAEFRTAQQLGITP